MLYFAGLMHSVSVSGPFEASLPWAESLGLELSFYVDGLGLLFAFLITAIGSLIVIFSTRYFDGDPRAGRFQATLFAFMGSMLGIVLANNLLLMFVFWELTGFTSFLLIGFDQERAEARASAIQAFIVTGTGGMGLLAAGVLIQQASGTVNLTALLAGNAAVQSAGTYPWIVVLILFAAFTKSAQVPFHFWLPNAMAAPTPVSAYLHSATMVKAGLYLVARMMPIAGGTPLWIGLAAGAGAITMVLGAWRAVGETDLKRVLAYSTVSALGLLMMLLGVGTQGTVVAALVYLCAHACYKGTLFLVAGTIEHETGTRDVTSLGGLRHSMPLVACAGALAACSMMGLPLFLGFIGKELVYDTLPGGGAPWLLALLVASVAASALRGSAGFIAGVLPFAGPPGKIPAEHRVPLALAIPPLILAAAGLLTGVWPAVLDVPVGLAASSIIRAIPGGHLALWHGLTWAFALSLLTFAIAGALYRWRDVVRARIRVRDPGFERLYTGTLGALDAISAWSLPALQGASLRSYVRALMITAGTLVTLVLVFHGLPSWPVMSGVNAPEAAAALMIVGGAISAARAKSTIQAVLSLGITGYGVALTFLFFGAPDLAMTQFSVETLTAVIFVLVFYRFPSLGLLSPLRVRIGDALIALLVGGSISVVLLFVAASKTPDGLAGYFAASAVPLAYGRNIVNVILVDFRSLDTMGEITVLATAAIGVRAVFRMGRRDGSDA
jgi:multicomponent Na+:H+ antiporter subunit A